MLMVMFSFVSGVDCIGKYWDAWEGRRMLLKKLDGWSFSDIWEATQASLGNCTFCLREGDGTPLQYPCLENPRDRGAWWAAVHGVTKSRTWLTDFTFTFHFHALEKEMATHSSVLAWRIPGMEEPGGLLSMGLHRVGHDWSDLAAAVRSIWGNEWNSCSEL